MSELREPWMDEKVKLCVYELPSRSHTARLLNWPFYIGTSSTQSFQKGYFFENHTIQANKRALAHSYYKKGKNPSSHFFQAKKKGNFFPLSLCAGGNVMVMLRHLYDILGIIEVMFFNFHTLCVVHRPLEESILLRSSHKRLRYGTISKECARTFTTYTFMEYIFTNVHAYTYIFFLCIGHIKNTKQCS